MNYIIAEDELPAAHRLQKQIAQSMPDAVCQAILSGVEESIQWLESHPAPDLAFFDIQLSDGKSFSILEKVNCSFPVIFTTAFDEYALKAFQANGIDYLLKPVSNEELKRSLEKYLRMFPKSSLPDYESLLRHIQPTASYRDRFAVKLGDHLKSVPVQDIAYFFTQDKIQFLMTFEGKRYPIDFILDKLESQLDPRHFFRINRQFIVQLNAIDDMVSFSKARVKLKLKPSTDLDTIVSSERAHDFKLWIAGELR